MIKAGFNYAVICKIFTFIFVCLGGVVFASDSGDKSAVFNIESLKKDDAVKRLQEDPLWRGADTQLVIFLKNVLDSDAAGRESRQIPRGKPTRFESLEQLCDYLRIESGQHLVLDPWGGNAKVGGYFKAFRDASGWDSKFQKGKQARLLYRIEALNKILKTWAESVAELELKQVKREDIAQRFGKAHAIRENVWMYFLDEPCQAGKSFKNLNDPWDADGERINRGVVNYEFFFDDTEHLVGVRLKKEFPDGVKTIFKMGDCRSE